MRIGFEVRGSTAKEIADRAAAIADKFFAAPGWRVQSITVEPELENASGGVEMWRADVVCDGSGAAW